MGITEGGAVNVGGNERRPTNQAAAWMVEAERESMSKASAHMPTLPIFKIVNRHANPVHESVFPLKIRKPDPVRPRMKSQHTIPESNQSRD